MIQEQRINSLRRILSSDSQAALVTNETNVYYFSGIRNSEGKILLFKDEVYLLVDFRYSETARNNCKSCKVFEFRNLREDIKELMTKHGAKALYIENEDVTLSAYNSYVEYFSQFGIEIMNENALSKAITNLRLIKSEKDILKSIQMLPGVKAESEGSCGFEVRGGTAAQNLVRRKSRLL